jgi:hypothetical protein
MRTYRLLIPIATFLVFIGPAGADMFTETTDAGSDAQTSADVGGALTRCVAIRPVGWQIHKNRYLPACDSASDRGNR